MTKNEAKQAILADLAKGRGLNDRRHGGNRTATLAAMELVAEGKAKLTPGGILTLASN